MIERDDGAGWKSSTRGESAWKDERERVATRNDAARRSGKLEREAYERKRETLRRSAEQRRHAKLVSRRTP